jgi:hypothetical protein
MLDLINKNDTVKRCLRRGRRKARQAGRIHDYRAGTQTPALFSHTIGRSA